MKRFGQRGIAFISSYLVLSVLLLYSGGMAMRAATQRLASERLEQRIQALHLAHGALEQLKQDLYTYFSNYVNAQVHLNDATQTFAWLDALGEHGERQENPPLDVPAVDRTGDGRVTWADVSGVREGTPANPRCVDKLPTIHAVDCASVDNTVGQPRAWIVAVKKTAPDALAPRLVTLEAQARVGSVTRHLRAQYELALGASDVFRYAYFINNYGWFDAASSGSPAWITVNGEIRSGSDLMFTNTAINVHGELYASDNPTLVNPITGAPATGAIAGDPSGFGDSWGYPWSWYRWQKTDSVSGLQLRPARRLTDPGYGNPPFPKPPIGGTPKILPLGSGYDDTNLVPIPQPDCGEGPCPVVADAPTAEIQQRRFERQPAHEIPYLGNLDFYQTLAAEQDSSLLYATPGPDGRYGTMDDARAPAPVRHLYAGPDGTPGTADDDMPLVLVGTATNPIVIDGPVIVPGDVIIKGVVAGRGTIYAGRNIHIVGEISYQSPPQWPLIDREGATGVLRDGITHTKLGTVCTDGRYVAPDETVPAGCI